MNILEQDWNIKVFEDKEYINDMIKVLVYRPAGDKLQYLTWESGEDIVVSEQDRGKIIPPFTVMPKKFLSLLCRQVYRTIEGLPGDNEHERVIDLLVKDKYWLKKMVEKILDKG